MEQSPIAMQESLQTLKVSVVHYIFSNPMRKGLVDNFEKYPFLGSFELDVTKMRSELMPQG